MIIGKKPVRVLLLYICEVYTKALSSVQIKQEEVQVIKHHLSLYSCEI